MSPIDLRIPEQVHAGLGHPTSRELVRVLKYGRARPELVRGAARWRCALCETEARLAPEQLGVVFSAKHSQGRRIVLRCQVEREAVDTREGAGEVSSVTHALRERVASLEERIHNLYQILALQAVVMIAVVLYKSFSF